MLQLHLRHSLWFRVNLCAQVCFGLPKPLAWYVVMVDECVDWLMMRKQLRKPKVVYIFEGWFPFYIRFFLPLLNSSPNRDSMRYSKWNAVNCTAYSPPTPHSDLLVHWSIWWDMVRIDGRVVMWILHRLIHFVLPIRAAVVFVWPIPLASVRLTFLAIIIQTNDYKRMENENTHVATQKSINSSNWNNKKKLNEARFKIKLNGFCFLPCQLENSCENRPAMNFHFVHFFLTCRVRLRYHLLINETKRRRNTR